VSLESDYGCGRGYGHDCGLCPGLDGVALEIDDGHPRFESLLLRVRSYLDVIYAS
jgi:hypothetical protein